MENKSDEWLDPMNDDIREHEGSFEGEIWLSTDAKNTVRVKATTADGRKAGLAWAKAVYDRLLFSYGTKQSVSRKEYSGEEDLGKCVKCGANNLRSQKGKVYCSAKCWLGEKA